MQHAIERRQAGAARMAFDEKVDVGGEQLPPFEANAVDVSREGLHLTSPFLPELGQPLSCRFSVGESEVICEGTVVWRQENASGSGHEFGLRFTALDSESARTLSELMLCQPSMAMHEQPAPETRASSQEAAHSARGARIRLHIEGLGAPMRARVRDASAKTVSAQSELGFLQLGKELQLEDATTGQKRSARIDQVEVELDPNTHVPQLVVELAYLSQPIVPVTTRRDDAYEASAPEEAHTHEAPDTNPEPRAVQREVASLQAASIAPVSMEKDENLIVDPEIAEESARMKGPVAGAFAKITPAVMASSQKAYVAMRALWAKRKGVAAPEAPVRRTTALPPGGGVASKVRRQTRGPNSMSTQAAAVEPELGPKDKALVFAKTHKRKLAAGGALGFAALLAGLALGQGSDDKPLATAPQEAPVAANVAAAPAAPVAAPVAAPAAAPAPVQAMNPAELPVDTGFEGGAEDDLAGGDRVATSAPRPKRVARPFGRGKIEHGKAFRMKMDGPIEDIQGAQLPEGFLVTLPERRSLEGAAALFKQDPRVLKAKVDNTSHGAELELTFKDGTPSYVVRARGETLEIVLSNPEKGSTDKATARTDSKKSDKNDKTARTDGKNGKKTESDKRDAKNGKKDKGGIERASVKTGRNRSR